MHDHSQNQKMSEDHREAYQAPELKDLGKVTEVTKSSFSTVGSDAGYS